MAEVGSKGYTEAEIAAALSKEVGQISASTVDQDLAKA